MMHLAKAYLSRETGLSEEKFSFTTLYPYFVKTPFPNIESLDELKPKIRAIKFPRLFLIDFIRDGKKNLTFKRITTREYNTEDDKKICLFDASGGNYVTPTFKISAIKKKGSNTERIKEGIEKAIKNLIKYFKSNFKDENTIGYEISLILDKDQHKITEQLYLAQIGIFSDPAKASLNFNSILSVRVNDKYVNEIDEILQITEKKILETRFRFDTKPKKKQNICSLCHEQSEFISGRVATFSFYTVDKAGYVAGGFNKKNAHFNYPVCNKCALLLEVAKRVLQNKFSFKIGNEKCYIIPKNLGSLDSLSSFLDVFEEGISKLSSKQQYSSMKDRETDLLEILSSSNDSIVFNFLFYDLSGPGNSVFSILLHIQDVLPSRIKIIAEAIEKASSFDPHAPFYGLDSKTNPMVFRFNNLRDLFVREDGRKIDRQAYFKILWCIFKGENVSFHHLIERFFKRLNFKLFSDEKTKLGTPTKRLNNEVKKMLPIIKFLYELNQIKK